MQYGGGMPGQRSETWSQNACQIGSGSRQRVVPESSTTSTKEATEAVSIITALARTAK